MVLPSTRAVVVVSYSRSTVTAIALGVGVALALFGVVLTLLRVDSQDYREQVEATAVGSLAVGLGVIFGGLAIGV